MQTRVGSPAEQRVIDRNPLTKSSLDEQARIGAQLLQILRRQKELMVALPLCDLKQPADAAQPCLLDPVN